MFEGGFKLITVTVEYPILQKDTINYVWHANEHIPFFKQEKFYVKYEGMNIENFSIEVYWQIFLSTLIPIFNLSEEPVVLIFPESIPSYLAETWINYHLATNVKIAPLSDKGITKVDTCDSIQDNARVGLLYGGGKDSACAFTMFSELYGVENMLLISYVAPHDRNLFVSDDIRRRQLLLEPLQEELNVKVQTVITDIRAIMIGSDTAKHIHLAMFMGPALPIIIHYNLSILTFSYEFDLYWTSSHTTGRKKFYFSLSRPEFCNYISKRTNTLFGTNFILINPNFSFSNLVAFKILASRYPYMIKHLLMCEDTSDINEKWCYSCDKCAKFALYCLYYWRGEEFIDISRALTQSPIFNRALSPEGLLENSYCNIVASIDPEYVAQKVSEEAFAVFMALREKFSKWANPSFESFIAPAFEKLALPQPLGDNLKSIITEYAPVLTEVQPYLFGGRLWVDIDYSLTCDIPNTFKGE
jgi:hypothetical protein